MTEATMTKIRHDRIGATVHRLIDAITIHMTTIGVTTTSEAIAIETIAVADRVEGIDTSPGRRLVSNATYLHVFHP